MNGYMRLKLKCCISQVRYVVPLPVIFSSVNTILFMWRTGVSPNWQINNPLCFKEGFKSQEYRIFGTRLMYPLPHLTKRTKQIVERWWSDEFWFSAFEGSMMGIMNNINLLVVISININLSVWPLRKVCYTNETDTERSEMWNIQSHT